MKFFGGIYTGICMVGVVEDVWCTVLFFNSWMKEKILPFKIYAVLSNFYINSWMKEKILPFKIYAVLSNFYLKKFTLLEDGSICQCCASL